MDILVLDCDYTYDKKNTPVIRVYGLDVHSDDYVCLHVYGFEPYIYVGVPPELDFDKFNRALLNELNGYYKRIEVVERYKPIGYQTKKTKMLKVVFWNPKVVPDVRRMIPELFEDMDESYIYEADILFRDRFMLDYEIKGFSIIRFDHVNTKLDNYGINCDNLYIVKAGDFQVLNDKVDIDY